MTRRQQHLRQVDEPGNEQALHIGAISIGLVLALSLTAWSAGVASVLLTSGQVSQTSISQAPALLLGLAHHPGAPWLAWPEADRAYMPRGALLWWIAALPGLILVPLVLGALALLVRHALRDEDDAGDPRRARPPLGLLSAKARDGRFPLGRHYGLQVSSSAESHLLVIGPTGSGKTSACLIPALLTHTGGAIVLSTKNDIKTHTLAARNRVGEVLAWTPFGTAGDAWDMLAGCETWSGACERSEALVHAARLDIDSSVGQFWDSHTDRALAPYLLAAASSGKPPGAVYAWIASQRVDEAQRILAQAQLSALDRDSALLDLRTAGLLSADDRSSLAISLIRVLAALRQPELARNLSAGFTPERLADHDRPATLYITVPAEEQRRARAFVIALVEASYLAAYRAGSKKPFEPPLLLLIDEAAHTAPLRDLPQMTQVARDAGIRIATSWQDASQIQHRYGREQANTLISASQTRVILPGCSDPVTQELVRASIGEPARTRPDRRDRPALDPRRLEAKMLISHRYDHAFLLRPAPWFRNRRLRRLAVKT